ncbi:cytochrome P450 [Dongia mobilis]|uniref:Cytochrome P450 n=1 Tax=Dongia mobilis TaxID=578943 RepID=A0A4R6WYX9_9PROT|nr:cytochrome P450 [Dongia mobilis]TDQ83007.1 cytochrome P450 [Dongia mobilis]
MGFAEKITVVELETDPYPIYARMRREAPVAYVPAVNIWLVTRWSDVEFVAKSPHLFTAEVNTSPVERTFGKPTILTTDGPVHKELRAGIDPKYKPKAVALYIDDLVRPIAEKYLAPLLAKGGGDLMAEYFEPISTLSLARSFGFHDIDMPTLRRWFYGLAQGAINFENDPERQKIGDAVSAEISAVAERIFERLERQPDDSALSRMLHDGMPAGRTRPRELLLPTVKVTLLGGMQEPGHGAGSVLVGLLQNPAQFAALRGDLANLLPRAVDEGLRWVAPIGTQTRQATQGIELGGAFIPAGAAVGALVSSASRDEARFAEPDAYNLFRDEGPHAAFGFGQHFCSGRWFARAQVITALRVLIEGCREIALDPANPPLFRGWEFRAPTSLRVTLCR